MCSGGQFPHRILTPFSEYPYIWELIGHRLGHVSTPFMLTNTVPMFVVARSSLWHNTKRLTWQGSHSKTWVLARVHTLTKRCKNRFFWKPLSGVPPCKVPYLHRARHLYVLLYGKKTPSAFTPNRERPQNHCHPNKINKFEFQEHSTGSTDDPWSSRTQRNCHWQAKNLKSCS